MQSILKALPAPAAGATLRLAFPLFYLFVVATAALAALLWWSHDAATAVVMAAVALSTIPLRQLLMPAINRATDSDERLRFKWLHGASVLVTLSHMIRDVLPLQKTVGLRNPQVIVLWGFFNRVVCGRKPGLRQETRC